MVITKIIKTVDRIWHKRFPKTWLDYLRRQGMRIGNGTALFSNPRAVLLDLAKT